MTDIILAKLENRESEIERYSYFPPYCILYLANALEKNGFTVQVIHQEGTKKNIAALAKLSAREKPLMIGLSTLTGPNIIPTVEASIAIKKVTASPIVWGGHHATILPDQTLENPYVDIVVKSEGEETVVDLARMLREHGAYTPRLQEIPGLAYKTGDRIVHTEPRPFRKNINDFSPAWHHLNPEDYFFSEKIFRAATKQPLKVASLITSRGCPWRCTYCYNQTVNKRRFRAQSAGKAIQDIRALHKDFQINAIIYEDDNFFTDTNRALEIVGHVDLPWSSTLRADDIARGGKSFIKQLKETRCLELRIGAESGSQRMLDYLKKDITKDQIRETARLCDAFAVTAAFMFMVGFPGESWSDILETLDLIDELNALHSPYVMVTQLGSYTPYPGTPLYDEAVRLGFKPPDTTIGWGTFVEAAYRNYRPPYVTRQARSVTYYHHLISRTDLKEARFSLPARIIQKIAKWRWRKRFFHLPLDHTIPTAVMGGLRKLGMPGMIGKFYKK
jgi:anaerobic magnesium-protoporphyrin IX monomethyl ester cyclase